MKEDNYKTVHDEKPCIDAESADPLASADGAHEELKDEKSEPQKPAEEGVDEPSENGPENIDNGNSFETEQVAKLIEEAENRGYLRGRNEKIEELMAAPGMYRPRASGNDSAPGLPPTEILANLRRSVWD